jgi:hypothetical protein
MKEVDQLLEDAALVESAEHSIGPVGKEDSRGFTY